MGWISPSQQKRDHKGLRHCCAACGHDGSVGDKLKLSDTGMRVHESHLNDPKSGFYGKGQ